MPKYGGTHFLPRQKMTEKNRGRLALAERALNRILAVLNDEELSDADAVTAIADIAFDWEDVRFPDRHTTADNNEAAAS